MMNKCGRPKPVLTLTDDKRQKLETWTNRPKSTQRLATGARIVLACADGLDNQEVADRLEINTATVGKWRRRVLDLRLDGLADESRPGAPRTIPDEIVERVVAKTLEEKPGAAAHCSTASWRRPPAGPDGHLPRLLEHPLAPGTVPRSRVTVKKAMPPHLGRSDHAARLHRPLHPRALGGCWDQARARFRRRGRRDRHRPGF